MELSERHNNCAVELLDRVAGFRGCELLFRDTGSVNSRWQQLHPSLVAPGLGVKLTCATKKGLGNLLGQKLCSEPLATVRSVTSCGVVVVSAWHTEDK